MLRKLVERATNQVVTRLISNAEVEAAAKAWLKWQFPNAEWDSASTVMRQKFMQGARHILTAAALARSNIAI